jgi:hypothetical protein
MIEPGWKLVDRDGDEAGRVADVVGEPEADIFTGLAVDLGVFSNPRYVPAESVTNIVEGFVQVDLSTRELDDLDPYEG